MQEKDNNLNLLRLVAAFLVLFEHSFAISGKPNFLHFLGSGFGHLGVKIFFIVSGYLIFASWNSSPKVLPFLWRRVLRIFPGLIVVTLLAALVLGPLLSTLPALDYFKHPGVVLYLKNIALSPVFALPGVFEKAPVAHAVNGSLWTLPLEFTLYLSIIFIGWFSQKSLLRYLLFFAAYFAVYSWAKTAAGPFVFYGIDWRMFLLYAIYFYTGSLFSVMQFKGELNINRLALAFFATVVGASYPSVVSDLIDTIAIGYIVLSFGLGSSRLGSWINHKGDLSYGVYIYAFPIQQSVFLLLAWHGMAWYMLVCSLLTLICAALSWFWVEKKMLALKNWL